VKISALSNHKPGILNNCIRIIIMMSKIKESLLVIHSHITEKSEKTWSKSCDYNILALGYKQSVDLPNYTNTEAGTNHN
jgi:hypothetical protein